MRGKRIIWAYGQAKLGITPACAGKTFGGFSRSGRAGDHPRVCGENGSGKGAGDVGKGSPPRVRGKQIFINCREFCKGITPACAGKTSDNFLYSARRGDHPRVCGENLRVAAARFFSGGSPPRVRGKHKHSAPCLALVGITPACAGKTFPSFQPSFRSQDHPRVCGENLGVANRLAHRVGSPPRVRGKPRWAT